MTVNIRFSEPSVHVKEKFLDLIETTVSEYAKAYAQKHNRPLITDYDMQFAIRAALQDVTSMLDKEPPEELKINVNAIPRKELQEILFPKGGRL
jgi:hypothetical protein